MPDNGGFPELLHYTKNETHASLLMNFAGDDLEKVFNIEYYLKPSANFTKVEWKTLYKLGLDLLS